MSIFESKIKRLTMCIIFIALPVYSFASVKNEVTKTVAQSTTTQSTEKVAPPVAKVNWTLESINNAAWGNLGRGQFPTYARAQVMLNNLHASPGAIDAKSGKNFLKALSAYQQMNGFPVTGELTKQTWDSLVSKQKTVAYGTYTITAQDLKGPYAKSIPRNYALQAKMPGLYYTRVTEMLGEKFHIDEEFLRQLNPKVSFKTAGEKIIVPNVRNDLPADVSLIVAHKGARQLYLFNTQNHLIASFPATIGGSDTPSPKGTHKVVKVAPNPYYGYSPKNFVQGGNKKPLTLPPGPNGPVGNIWFAASY